MTKYLDDLIVEKKKKPWRFGRRALGPVYNYSSVLQKKKMERNLLLFSINWLVFTLQNKDAYD